MTDKNKQEIGIGDTLSNGKQTLTVYDFENEFAKVDNGFVTFKINQNVLDSFVIIKRAENENSL